MPPEERRIGIVFQSYALWPHMTVAENVAYGLTVAGVKDPERARRVRRRARAGRARRLCRAPAGAAFRRPAPARRARALPRDRAVARAARRAARQSRRASARGDGARVRALPRAHRHDDDLHHARPDRSDGARRPDRGDGQGAACCSSRRRRSSIASRRMRRSRSSSARAWSCRSRSSRSHGDGTCDVDVFGHRVRMRCAARATSRGGVAPACALSAVRIVAPARRGLRARVTEHDLSGRPFSRRRAASRRKPEVALHLTVPEPCSVVARRRHRSRHRRRLGHSRPRQADACGSICTAVSAKKDAPVWAWKAPAFVCSSTRA